LMFLSPTFRRIISRRPCTRRGTGRVRRAKPLLRQGLILLIAYIMFISPEAFHQLSQADIAFSQLATTDWASGNRAITYTYDDNGSVTSKTTKKITSQETLEVVTYEYNLQGRLAKMTVDDGSITVTEYEYDPDGNRIAKTVGGVTTTYLIDAYNHTGYAQTFVEDDGTDTTCYVIGDDVLAQAVNITDPQYLLYDGHGSTRQLSNGSGSLVPDESYSYDAYGVMLGGERQTATNLLYTGEYRDSSSQNYYLRARWYNPSNGLFNRVDPYSGNYSDPQSLHKYLYCHANPINAIDPTGMDYTNASQLTVGMVVGELITMAFPFIVSALLALVVVTSIHIVYDLIDDYIAAGLSTIANAIQRNKEAVQRAIKKAIESAKKTGRELKKLLKFKKFVFFRTFFSEIFDFNMRCLSRNPSWFVLYYLADPIKARANRSFVKARYGHLRRPGRWSIDEFPYASTFQGGRGARGEAVPIHQNFIQGGYLGAFCRWILKTTPQPFLVVPVPI